MTTEVRLAFAFNGGVSLAIWIGGVTDEVLRCINGGRLAAEGRLDEANGNPYAALCAELDVVPKADVLTGTSAGGLNAAFLATAVSHGCTDLEAIRRLWLEHGSFDLMMRPPTDQTLVSLLAGDENFLPHIEDALQRLVATGIGFREPDPPVVVHLTSTSLSGQVTTLRDGEATIASVDHRAEFVFHNDDFDFDSDPNALKRMARACRSSASFPVAFEPSAVPATLFEERHTWGLFDDGDLSTKPVIDGGLLVNLPAQAALEAIVRQPSRERVERVLALVVPDPSGEAGSDPVENPTLGDVVKKALVGIPLSQSLTDFVRELDEHNREVRARRGARDALFAALAAAEPAEGRRRMVGLAEALLPAYRAIRLAATLDPSRLAANRGLRLVAREAGLGDLLDVRAGHAPWVPERLSVGDDTWCWGSSAVRRLGSVLITWVNAVAEWADPATEAELLAIKGTIAGARGRAERIAPSSGALAGLLAEELAADGSSLPAAFERACARWPGGTEPPVESIRALNAGVATLAGCLGRLVELARGSMDRWPDDEAGRALRGVVRLADGAEEADDLSTLLLCIEVVEGCFAGADPRPDQEVRLVQFTATGPCDIDPRHRDDPAEKLAGVELAHFGAFLKASWRANDWLWGRLDAAQRLLRLLDAVAGNRLSRAGTLEQHTAAVQAAVLREELPTLVAELARDAERGARVTPEAAAFVEAVRGVGTTTADGRLDLSAAGDDQLRELLGLQLVGAEDISLEAGSNLATVTSIAALRTGARVLHRQGPRVLRGPTRVLGATSSLAERLTRRGWGVSRSAVLVALIAVTGLVGLTGSFLALLTDVPLGWFSYVAFACLLVTPLLAVLAAPWLLLGAGRRQVARER
ncbi:MAG TPA: patatin-like protein [Nocardioides sp.]|uniref:patatin-like protein n=1 Tax=Nocardioides sp. TaxID=35761 RepID=UPI002E3213EC|nr:patatin-like protein [Nocardioides sp.]HEX5089218.1 patatin-like protein [Nocardioides sp.]